ncbi:esterase/lipase family protein [Streptomyces microflavus]|uniref:esterase/lipase family protein n=1 Tax=Streptomyces microflavus TaxID=1919 RepID=UPI0037F52DF7
MQRFEQRVFERKPFGKSHSMNLHTRTSGPAKRIVVFIHGLMGSGYGTWGKWPTLLFEDDKCDTFDVALYYYPSALKAALRLRPGADIDLQAQQLAEHLTELSKEYEEIYLIAHSLGGLVAEAAVSLYLQDLVIKSRDCPPVSSVAAIFLMASPVGGSGKALLMFSFFRDVRRLRLLSKEQASYAQFFNSHVQVQCLASAGKFRFIIPRYAGIATLDVAVSPTSASGSLPGDQQRRFKGTHFSIAKPSDASDAQHIWLLDSMRDVQEMRAQWRRNLKQKQLAKVVNEDSESGIFVTRLEGERRRSAWDITYNQVRANSSTSYVEVLDYNHVKPGTKVDLLITVNYATGVVAKTPASMGVVVGAIKAFETGSVTSVGICPVGEQFAEAEEAVEGWLPATLKNKFYIEGANDDAGIGAVVSSWIDAILYRHPSRQSAIGRQRSLQLNYDAYEETEDL